MIYFNDDIPPGASRKLRKLDEWFQDYACDGLLGEKLEPSPLLLGAEAQPTIALVEDIDDIEVLEAEDLGDGIMEARCQVKLGMELELNDEDDNTASTEATLGITLEIDTRKRKITGHHVHDAYSHDY